MRRYTNDKDLNTLIRIKEGQGWTVSYGRHLKLRSPGGRLVSTSISPSCRHVANQVARDINRIEKLEKNCGQ